MINCMYIAVFQKVILTCRGVLGHVLTFAGSSLLIPSIFITAFLVFVIYLCCCLLVLSLL